MVFILILFFFSVLFAQENTFQETHRFPASEAHQGVAVDEKYFYAIGSKSIGKYNKKTGALIKQWESWIFPDEILNRFGKYSCSGGSWGPDGLLYCSGHDLPELYVLRLPKFASILELVDILPINNQGQGIAWDRSENNIIYIIHRKKKTVIVNHLSQKLD
jgi:hypothetical protein